MALTAEQVAKDLRSATAGFEQLFSNDLDEATKTFSAESSPFHQLGAGVCAFLEAALGMEVCVQLQFIYDRRANIEPCVPLLFLGTPCYYVPPRFECVSTSLL